MNPPDNRHPAGHGLMDSGYVVSVIRTAADIRTHILGDGYFIGVTLPGNPCDVLVCLSAKGAEALTTELAEGLDRLRTEQSRPQ